MKQTLLPIALLALSLPGTALAAPVTVIYGTPGYQPVVPVVSTYRPTYTLRPSSQPYRVVTGPTAVQLPVVPVVPVNRYGVPGSYGYVNPSVSYGYGGSVPIYDYNRTTPPYGYRQPLPYTVAGLPKPLVRSCAPNAGRVLIGATLGGLTSAALAPNSRTRTWAIPVGAALGGLGGLATGC